MYSSKTITFGTATRELYFREKTSDEDVIQSILFADQYNLDRIGRSEELFEFGKQQESGGLRPLVVDAGANIGVSPLNFILRVPNSLVVAIEPELENFKLLSKNVEGLDVEVIHGAVSSQAGRARVIDPGRGHWAYQTRHIANEIDVADSVPCLTINDIYTFRRSTTFPFIVKIDIEGSEQELFSNNTEWVAVTPLIIVELHDWMLPKDGTSRPFLQCISKLNRDFVYMGEDIYSIANDLQT